MTTIAFSKGIMAADSANTVGGVIQNCQKLVRKKVGREEHIIGLAGSSHGMQFLEWYGTNKAAPSYLEVGEPEENGWEALVLTPDGLLYYNGVTVPERLGLPPYFAMGSGGAVAIGAMSQGASARAAVLVAEKHDPNTRGPVISMRLRQK